MAWIQGMSGYVLNGAGTVAALTIPRNTTLYYNGGISLSQSWVYPNFFTGPELHCRIWVVVSSSAPATSPVSPGSCRMDLYRDQVYTSLANDTQVFTGTGPGNGQLFTLSHTTGWTAGSRIAFSFDPTSGPNNGYTFQLQLSDNSGFT